MRATLGVGSLAAAMLVVACGGDSGSSNGDAGTGTDGGGTMDAGATDGGARDTGSSSTTDGGGGGDDACVSTGRPLLNPEDLPICPSCPAGGARCIPAGIVPAELRDQLQDCDMANECVPDVFILTNGRFLLPSCRSVGDAEGRCLSVCVPAVAAQADMLPVATCAENERCVPCFDPTSGEETGACGLACDPGPAEPPTAFERCCGGIGACVPRDLVPADQAGQLGRDTCASDTTLCAPDALIAGDRPMSCRSLADAEGRCLPECLPAVSSQLDRLPVSSCGMGERCVPCFDPTTGEETGGCRVNGDMPAEPPRTFDRCCGGRGSCVPSTLVAPEEAAQLGRDTCTDAASLCAPDSLATTSTPPPSCRSVGDAEGRCLSSCLPAIAAQASLLPRSTCAEGDLCAPCFDPLTGMSTGACGLRGDMPAEPPRTFDRCCGGIGACVPRSLVPPEDAAQLGTDSCTAPDTLCAPDELRAEGFRPPACRSVADAEGRCLPSCLPAIAAQAAMLPRSTCAATHLCAPCFDPTDGTDTGACRQSGDMPTEPPYVFPGCCAYGGASRGRCVPETTLPPERASSLPQDDCDMGDLCVPNPFLDDPDYTFPACVTGGLLGGDPGACVPDCIVGFFEGLLLTRSTCAAGELCAPCVNPITGAESGACG